MALRSITIIIATRNRPLSLKSLLGRLSTISMEFERVIVVDASDDRFSSEVARVISEIKERGLPLELIHCKVGSLTYQKNLALDACTGNEIVQILDDDVLPPPGYLTHMAYQLQLHNLAGISGVTQETKPILLPHMIFGRIFGLVATSQGKVSIGGIGFPIEKRTSAAGYIHPAQWLIGCSMWDLSKVGSARFHRNFIGSALFEDVEFSLRIGKGFKLGVDPTQILTHKIDKSERPDVYTYWYRFSRNRFEVVRNISSLPKVVFLWSTIGVILQILFGTQMEKRKSLKGLLDGLRAAIMNGNYR